VKQSHKTLLLWLLLIVMMIAIYQLVEPSDNPREVAFSQFVTDVRQGHVESVTVSPGAASSAIFEYVHVEADRRERCTTEGVIQPRAARAQRSSCGGIWSSIIPLVVQSGRRQGDELRQVAARACVNESQNKVTFADVAGIDEAKDEVEEIIAFLKDPKKFRRLGGRIPKGVLLAGPPGTGKTLLARAIAGEAGVPFFSISGSDFVEMFVGVGASRVRDLFEQGKKHAPCIIFIDEIDAVGRHRGAGLGGGHDEREQTLNQLLVEMDGFEANEGVIIIAATNRPDVLDPRSCARAASTAASWCPAPTSTAAIGILQVHTKKTPLAEDVDLEVLARGTPGMSGADLENLVNEAALLAARQDKDSVSMTDFEMAKDKVRMGSERRSMLIPEKEKRTTAWHEAGHTLVGMMVPNHDPIHKVTIIPRGPALGVTFVLPKEDVLGRSKEQLESMIAMALGGRIAEEIKFGEKTSGAASDLQRVTQLARAMVTQLGMSDNLGPLVYGEREDDMFGMGSPFKTKEYSEQTAREIDDEVRRIIQGQYERARKLIEANLEKLDAIANALLERETIDSEELLAIMEGRELPARQRVVIPRYSDKAAKAKEKRKASIFQPRPREIPSGT
jgi:cell division protease FtsH